MFVGLLQVAQGPESPLRFSKTGDIYEAVGFLANRNHFSALLYVLLLPAIAWAIATASRGSEALASSRFEAGILLPQIACISLVLMLLATVLFTRSRAGLGLTMVALVGAVLLAASARRTTAGPASGTSPRLLVAAFVAGALALSELTVFGAVERLTADPFAGARTIFARNTLEAALAHMPLGTGLGTFVPVHALFERQSEALLNAFANRAHNDYLELWLEAGIPGIAIIGLFLAWFVRAGLALWRRPGSDRDQIDILLARSASIAVLLLLLHSVVDYPLRTTALLTVFAFLCALMTAPPVRAAAASAAARGAGAARPAASSTSPSDRGSATDARPPMTSPTSQPGRPAGPGRTPATGSSRPLSGGPAGPGAGGPATPRPWQGGGDWPDDWRRK